MYRTYSRASTSEANVSEPMWIGLGIRLGFEGLAFLSRCEAFIRVAAGFSGAGILAANATGVLLTVADVLEQRF
ncbi:unnamed protein product [Sphagnum troendelagicum]|uniref:Uncharacterized protein n=1 Tax=Sphagnum troendelagicum TaxID=128251 RepID=A0ABP0TM71_9BRYO